MSLAPDGGLVAAGVADATEAVDFDDHGAGLLSGDVEELHPGDAGRRARCTKQQLRALQAVVSYTAMYSKLGDHVALRQLAEDANLDVRDTSKALKALREAGLIEYHPGRGSGHLSYVALKPSTTQELDATAGSNTGRPGRGDGDCATADYPTLKVGNSRQDKAGDSERNRRAIPLEKRTEKRSEENPEERPLPWTERTAVMASGYAQQDEIFASLILICGRPGTDLEEFSYAQAAKLLLTATPAATHERLTAAASTYERRWPAMPITPNALAKHWGALNRTLPSDKRRGLTAQDMWEQALADGLEPSPGLALRMLIPGGADVEL